MLHGGEHVGRPVIQYTDTKANIEALSGVPEGAHAYATDTDEPGWYDGLAWVWGGGSTHELLFSQVVDVEVVDTTTETTLLGAGRGAKTISADTLDVGTTIRITAGGYLSCTGTPTLDIDCDLGGTEVCNTGAITLASGLSNAGWRLEIEIVCRSTGATGSVVASGTLEYGDGNQHDFVNTSAVTVDTTGSLAVDLTQQWGAADASNSQTCQECTIEIMKADGLAVASPSDVTATEV